MQSKIGDGWIKVYSSTQVFKVELMKGVLENNGMDAVIVNRQDSSYLTFGEIELYTLKIYANKAIGIIASINV
jgi:hypothetical protein